MIKYYLLSWNDTIGSLASAYAPEGVDLAHDLIEDLTGLTELPFDLNLVKLSDGEEQIIKSEDLNGIEQIWLDYQPNSLAWPIMSAKMKGVIEKNLTGNEEVDWITVKINGAGEQRIYYILRFNKLLDVLNMDKSMFVEGTDALIIPVLDSNKIAKYNICMALTNGYGNLYKITSGIYVSDVLRKAIQHEKLTGIEFDKARIA